MLTCPSVSHFLALGQHVLHSVQVVFPFSTSERKGLTVPLTVPLAVPWLGLGRQGARWVGGGVWDSLLASAAPGACR